MPPPTIVEFVYVANRNSISAFQLDSAGKLEEIAGSPFEMSSGTGGLISDPKSRFLLLAQPNGYLAINIGSSHGLTLTSNQIPLSGYDLMDPLGRFFYVTDVLYPLPPMHGYSVTADLSFREVPGSPFDIDVWPAAVDPAGKFIFGLNTDTNTIATLQIGETGTLTKTSAVPTNYAPWDAAIDPSGRFLYVGSFQSVLFQEDLYVYNVNSAGVLTAARSELNFIPGKAFAFVAFHPAGNFVFLNECEPCQLDTFTIDHTTGYINPTPVFSLLLPSSWMANALDSTGAYLFMIAGAAEVQNFGQCTDPGLHGTLTVFALSTAGKLDRITGVPTADACPVDVAVVK